MEGIRGLNKHQQKTEATKSKLFKSAQKVFAKQGFEAASIDQIAKTAGFSRGAFYAHFKTKEDLFFAMLEERAAMELVRLRKTLEETEEENQLSVLRDYCAARLKDIQWSLLQLEFKLYIARRGAKGAKIAERYQTLRQNIKRQYIAEALSESVEAKKSAPGNQMLIEAIIDGLSLQKAYKGNLAGEEELEHQLKRAFDALMTLD